MVAVVDLDAAARRVARGDARAFRAIVDATAPRLYRVAVRMMGDADDARDVLQDAFVRAHRALVAGELEGELRVGNWLYRIVLNTALNHRRGRTRRGHVMAPHGLPLAPVPSPETRAEASRVMVFVAELPPEQRDALLLKELEGHTSAEIGRLVGCTEGAVEQRLVRAREALRRRLQKREDRVPQRATREATGVFAPGRELDTSPDAPLVLGR